MRFIRFHYGGSTIASVRPHCPKLRLLGTMLFPVPGASMRRREFLEVQRGAMMPSGRSVAGNSFLSAIRRPVRPSAMLLLLSCSGFLCGAVGFAKAQAISFTELEGARVEFNITRQQTNHFNNRAARIEIEENWYLELGPKQTVAHTTTAQAAGRPPAPTIKGTFDLGTPREVTSAGGGTARWVFEGNALVFTRTFIEGASRIEVSFKRKQQITECSVKHSFAREGGAGKVVLLSNDGTTRLEITNSRQISSNCRVLKG